MDAPMINLAIEAAGFTKETSQKIWIPKMEPFTIW